MKKDVLIRIVDDDASVRDALIYMLDLEGFNIVAYSSAEEFLVNDMPSRPGVVVLDVRMNGMSGTQLQEEMIRRRNKTPIIFLTGHGDIDMAVKAMRNGAFHFLQKPVDTEKLVKTIRECLQQVSRQRSREFVEEAMETLTPRERQIAGLLMQGLNNQSIAARLNLSVRTVENHRAAVYGKLRVNSYDELENLLRNYDTRDLIP